MARDRTLIISRLKLRNSSLERCSAPITYDQKSKHLDWHKGILNGCNTLLQIIFSQANSIFVNECFQTRKLNRFKFFFFPFSININACDISYKYLEINILLSLLTKKMHCFAE